MASVGTHLRLGMCSCTFSCGPSFGSSSSTKKRKLSNKANIGSRNKKFKNDDDYEVWKIKKVLEKSNIGTMRRLILRREMEEEFVLSVLGDDADQIDSGVSVQIWDVDHESMDSEWGFNEDEISLRWNAFKNCFDFSNIAAGKVPPVAIIISHQNLGGDRDAAIRVYARETENKESGSKPIAQYMVDARLYAIFEQSGEFGRSFNYSVPEQQIMAYLVKIQFGGFIQPFGSMIAIDEPSFRILGYSDNARNMLDITPQSVPSLDDKNDTAFTLGTDVRALFTHSSALLLKKAFSERKISLMNPIWIHSRTSKRPSSSLSLSKFV
ncbi:hypothetical protein JHK85_028171 [Glycine max]|nr:hypothetical protein JHK85_028171 [Glycine max]